MHLHAIHSNPIADRETLPDQAELWRAAQQKVVELRRESIQMRVRPEGDREVEGAVSPGTGVSPWLTCSWQRA